jgi:hypothetical protein
MPARLKAGDLQGGGMPLPAASAERLTVTYHGAKQLSGN